jgi:hypothetical protein
MTASRWEYRVCSLQLGKVLWENGAWMGRAPTTGNTQEILASCPDVWTYLNAAGAEGWELVSAAAASLTRQESNEAVASNLFLKRPV